MIGWQWHDGSLGNSSRTTQSMIAQLSKPIRAHILFPGPSVCLLAACLFMAAFPTLKVYWRISYSDVLFVVAVVCGLFERLLHKETVTSEAMGKVLLCYLFSAALLVLCFFINMVDGYVATGQVGVDVKYAGNFVLTQNSKVLFGGYVSQVQLFFLFFFNAALMPILIMLIRVKNASEFRFLIIMWTAGALCDAAYTFAYCNGWISHYDQSWVQLGRAQGMTAQANILGLYTMLALPGLLYLFSSSRILILRAMCLVGIFLVWKVVNYTGSRSCLVGAILIIPLFFVAKEINFREKLKVGFIIVVTGFLLFVLQDAVVRALQLPYHSALSRLLEGSRSSDTVRGIVNSIAWDQAVQNPIFGAGYQVLLVSHNIYLQLFHAAGIVGLLAYLIILSIPVMMLCGVNTQGEERLMSAALLSAIGSVLVIYWTKNNPSAFVMAMFCALAVHWGLAVRKGGSRFSALFDPYV